MTITAAGSTVTNNTSGVATFIFDVSPKFFERLKAVGHG